MSLLACQSQQEAMELVCQSPVACEPCAAADPGNGERQVLLAQYLADNVSNRSVKELLANLPRMSPDARVDVLEVFMREAGVANCPFRDLYGPLVSEDNVHLLMDPEEYPFLTSATLELDRLEARFPVPAGYRRVQVADGSFAAWLRGLPVTRGEAMVKSYDGRALQAPAAAVVPLDLGAGDVQQCADSILRLHAEYQWQRGAADGLSIHFTSGDPSTWKAWREGERFEIAGSRVNRVHKGPVANTHREFRKWLQHSFLYAGTRSLRHDAQPVPVADPLQPGDLFVSPGSPGHAVVILDVAQAVGKPPVALLGQGYMPAQDFHVLQDKGPHVVDGWFVLPAADGELRNPSWSPFSRSSALRFP